MDIVGGMLPGAVLVSTYRARGARHAYIKGAPWSRGGDTRSAAVSLFLPVLLTKRILFFSSERQVFPLPGSAISVVTWVNAGGVAVSATQFRGSCHARKTAKRVRVG